ncbi:hypothetical protein [Nitrosomonas sp.]|uniref:hypothetical protein n=1 Tax=Nitrosomonas sp. TaxID=42353 RepID=UPI0025D07B3B|nr:hypothetical protein [Nitrosomonas sp.]
MPNVAGAMLHRVQLDGSVGHLGRWRIEQQQTHLRRMAAEHRQVQSAATFVSTTSGNGTPARVVGAFRMVAVSVM